MPALSARLYSLAAPTGFIPITQSLAFLMDSHLVKITPCPEAILSWRKLHLQLVGRRINELSDATLVPWCRFLPLTDLGTHKRQKGQE